MTEFSTSSGKAISRPVAIGAVALLWLAYTVSQTLFVTGYLTESVASALGFLPGLLGVAVLMLAGLTREQLFLRMARLSWRGFAVLAGIFVLGLIVIVPFGQWQGWNWMAALVYAPASGIAQELFFRAVLLPALLVALKGRPGLALILHALLFSLWHIGPLFLGAPIWAVAAVMLVPFICGIGWGWQVRHDRTVVWAMVQHSLVWMIGGQFPIPA